MVSWNATQAAIDAGYSKKTAYSIGSENLTKPEIRERIDKRLSEMVMSADEVLKRLSDMAKVSLLPFIEITAEGFVYFDFSHPDAKNYMHLIRKIKSKRTRRITGGGDLAQEWEDEFVEVELHDAFAALVQVGKYHKLFTDNLDVKSDGKALQPKIDDTQYDRAISALAAAAAERESVRPADTKSDSAVDTAE